jgi:hypothetical protein
MPVSRRASAGNFAGAPLKHRIAYAYRNTDTDSRGDMDIDDRFA